MPAIEPHRIIQRTKPTNAFRQSQRERFSVSLYSSQKRAIGDGSIHNNP